MPENREEQTGTETTGAKDASAEATEARSSDADGAAPEVDLDLEGLDLTVETVEERISPSETNVFDK